MRISARPLRRIVLLRLRLRVGPHWIGWLTGAARSSVYAVLRRLGLDRLRALEPREPVVRYCWPHAGDLVHLDTKKLGRIGPGGGKRFGGLDGLTRRRCAGQAEAPGRDHRRPPTRTCRPRSQGLLRHLGL